MRKKVSRSHRRARPPVLRVPELRGHQVLQEPRCGRVRGHGQRHGHPVGRVALLPALRASRGPRLGLLLGRHGHQEQLGAAQQLGQLYKQVSESLQIARGKKSKIMKILPEPTSCLISSRRLQIVALYRKTKSVRGAKCTERLSPLY